jgi:colicin import membrane protein
MWISAAMHAGLLAFIVFGFAFAPKFDDATESIPVDTVTQNQFNEIMKGERDGKPMKEPPPTPAPKPVAEAPPPPPPPPELRTADAAPPAPAPVETPPPKQAPTPPAPPPKPMADDAPATPPAPPVRPKETPPPKPKPDAFKPDALAKLLEKAKDEPTLKAQKTQYDPNAIAKLIGENKVANADPTPTASTPRGLQSQNAPRMSPSLSAALDAWLTDAYLNCWTPPPSMPQGDRYIAQVQVQFNPDGSLAATPVLLNPPDDPAWRPHAESAVRAALKCNPLRVPAEYAPYFDQWRTKNIHFDPASALG